MARRAKKQQSVLRKQNPKRRKSRWRIPSISKRNLEALAILTVAVILIASGSYGLRQLAAISWDTQTKFHLKIAGANAEQRTLLATKVRTYLDQQMAKPQIASLYQLQERITKHFHPEAVDVMQTGHNQIFVSLRMRQPRFIAKLDKWRQVSTLGHVYAAVDDLTKAAQLPKLTGLQVKHLNFNSDKTGRVLLTDDLSAAIKAMLILLDATDRLKIPAKEFVFVPQRGFLIRANEKLPDVMVGDTDFDQRLTRALKTVADLRKTERVATSIETDYAAKVFVRETKRTSL